MYGIYEYNTKKTNSNNQKTIEKKKLLHTDPPKKKVKIKAETIATLHLWQPFKITF